MSGCDAKTLSELMLAHKKTKGVDRLTPSPYTLLGRMNQPINAYQLQFAALAVTVTVPVAAV